MHGVLREAQARSLERGAELVSDGEEKWEMSQEEVQQRVLEGSEVLDAVRNVLKGSKMGLGVNIALYQQLIFHTSTYGAETGF